MTLGQKINKFRTEKKWSQEKLAEAVGVSRQAVSKWVLDEAVPDVTNIISLSKIFSVSTDYSFGNTNAVYYRKSEPEYFFHLPAWLFSLEFQDHQYHQSIAASMVDDKIESMIQGVIPGELKMSSECMPMRFHEKPVISNDYSNIENIAYFQMYCVLDNSLAEQKDEIIKKVTEILEPLFWDAKATIFFAFVSDVKSSERYSTEYHNQEDTLVRFHQ